MACYVFLTPKLFLNTFENLINDHAIVMLKTIANPSPISSLLGRVTNLGISDGEYTIDIAITKLPITTSKSLRRSLCQLKKDKENIKTI
jgi:hypothetical protein